MTKEAIKYVKDALSRQKLFNALECIESLEKENEQLKQQNEKMKCCENCKHHSFWGNELKCNYGTKEALQEDKLVECEDMNKWELAE